MVCPGISEPEFASVYSGLIKSSISEGVRDYKEWPHGLTHVELRIKAMQYVLVLFFFLGGPAHKQAPPV